MTDDELRARATDLSAQGRTYAQIAETFAKEDVPGIWSRTSVERLMARAMPVAAAQAAASAPVDPVVAALARIEGHSRSTASWTALIGWIILAWAILTLATGVWLGVQVSRLAVDDEPVSETSSYLG